MINSEIVKPLSIIAIGVILFSLLIDSKQDYKKKQRLAKEKVIAINPNKNVKALMKVSIANCINYFGKNLNEEKCVMGNATNLTFETGVNYTKQDLALTVKLIEEINDKPQFKIIGERN